MYNTSCIQGTNDWSNASKASVAQKGYFKDDYISLFSSNKKFRAPLINHGYYIRYKAIEVILNQLDCTDIISFGAGFDTLPFRKKNLRFVEIDFPAVAKRKAEIIQQHSLIEDIYIDNRNNDDNIVLRSERYCLIGCDLRENDLLMNILVNKKLIKSKCKIMIISEVALCYLDQVHSDRLLKSLLFYDTVSYFVSYEPIRHDQHDNDGFAYVMKNHFNKINCPIKTLISQSDQESRFLSLGFKFVYFIDMLTFYWSLANDERKRILFIESFDEFEEFHLLCSNYGLTIASHEPIEHIYKPMKPKQPILEKIPFKVMPNPFNRYGHSSCQMSDGNILVFGGFGQDISHKKHYRRNDLIEINPDNQKQNFCIRYGKGRTNSKLVQLDDEKYMVIGGRSSPQEPLESLLIKKYPHKYECETINGPLCWRHDTIRLYEKIISVGGLNTNVFGKIFDINLAKWISLELNEQVLYSHSCTIKDCSTFILSGGIDVIDYKLSEKLIIIDLRSNKTTSLPFLKLYSHTSHLIGNQLLILGGITQTGHNNKIIKIDLRNNKFISEKSLNSPFMINSHTSHLKDQHLNILGGGGNCFSFGTFFNPFIKLSLESILN